MTGASTVGLLVSGLAFATPPITTVTDAKHKLRFAVPVGWTTESHSSYEIVSRGPEGGLETHVVVLSEPPAALHDYFLSAGEMGPVEVHGAWTCAPSRSWRLNPAVGVAVCSRQLANRHALVVSLTAEKGWLRKVGGVRFLLRLVVRMRGFRADDD
jgi:hypothetical protein